MADDPGLAAWSALLRVHAALLPRIAADFQRSAGFPLSWYDVLLELNAAEDGRLRMQVLGDRVVLSRSRVSRVVDELERAGFVAREPDATDGRSMFARILQPGRRAFRRSVGLYLSLVRERFSAATSAEEAAAMANALERVLTSVEARETRRS